MMIKIWGCTLRSEFLRVGGFTFLALLRQDKVHVHPISSHVCFLRSSLNPPSSFLLVTLSSHFDTGLERGFNRFKPRKVSVKSAKTQGPGTHIGQLADQWPGFEKGELFGEPMAKSWDVKGIWMGYHIAMGYDSYYIFNNIYIYKYT